MLDSQDKVRVEDAVLVVVGALAKVVQNRGFCRREMHVSESSSSGLRYVFGGDLELASSIVPRLGTHKYCAPPKTNSRGCFQGPSIYLGQAGWKFCALRRRSVSNSQTIQRRHGPETKIGGTPHQSRHPKCYSRLCGTTIMEHIHMRYILPDSSASHGPSTEPDRNELKWPGQVSYATPSGLDPGRAPSFWFNCHVSHPSQPAPHSFSFPGGGGCWKREGKDTEQLDEEGEAPAIRA